MGRFQKKNRRGSKNDTYLAESGRQQAGAVAQPHDFGRFHALVGFTSQGRTGRRPRVDDAQLQVSTLRRQKLTRGLPTHALNVVFVVVKRKHFFALEDVPNDDGRAGTGGQHAVGGRVKVDGLDAPGLRIQRQLRRADASRRHSRFRYSPNLDLNKPFFVKKKPGE